MLGILLYSHTQICASFPPILNGECATQPAYDSSHSEMQG